jgi:hypothetical protein
MSETDPTDSTPRPAVKILYNAAAIARIADQAAQTYCASFPPEIIARLRADPGGYVCAAFNRLQPRDAVYLMFLTVQAADLAQSRGDVAAHAKAQAEWYEETAKTAERLADAVKGWSSLTYQKPLRDLAQELRQTAQSYDALPGKYHLSRKNETPNAASILALRAIRARLYVHDATARVDHEALAMLTAAGLGIQLATNSRNELPGWVREALRAPGVSTTESRARMNKTRKPL